MFTTPILINVRRIDKLTLEDQTGKRYFLKEPYIFPDIFSGNPDNTEYFLVPDSYRKLCGAPENPAYSLTLAVLREHPSMDDYLNGLNPTG